MHTIGTGLVICPARRNVLQEGERSPLGVVPVECDTECLHTECLDIDCHSVVNCNQFAWGGGSAIPLLVIERRTCGVSMLFD